MSDDEVQAGGEPDVGAKSPVSGPGRAGSGGARARLTGLVGLLWASKLGLIGLATTTVSGCLLVTAIVAELSGFNVGQYASIVAYTLLPAVFVGGLLLMPVGMVLARRRLLREGRPPPDLFSKGFATPALVRAGLFFFGATAANLVILASVSYQAYHYTETVEFCGTLCHTVMAPEYTTHQNSPHSRVACVECHIGSGASWFVKSKLSGARQVLAVATGDYSRPIPSPVHNLRPARDTCEQCHWPQKFHGKYIKAVRRFTNEDTTDPLVSAVMLKVGGQDPKTGKYTGIHWHVSNENRVYYRTDDEKRLEIPEVRVVKPDGSEKLYRNAELPQPGAETPWREMDCVDCHNRPTHVFDVPEDAVDQALYQGTIDPSLPEVRARSLEVLKGAYASNEAGKKAVYDAFIRYYEEQHADLYAEKKASIDGAAETLSQLYGRNVFPEMAITWNTYPNQLGHKHFKGCFRCHDEEHESEDGSTISQDCDLCHNLMAEDDDAPFVLKALEAL